MEKKGSYSCPDPPRKSDPPRKRRARGIARHSGTASTGRHRSGPPAAAEWVTGPTWRTTGEPASSVPVNCIPRAPVSPRSSGARKTPVIEPKYHVP